MRLDQSPIARVCRVHYSDMSAANQRVLDEMTPNARVHKAIEKGLREGIASDWRIYGGSRAMSTNEAQTRADDRISLADEEGVKQLLVNSVLGLWDVVNNLARL